MRILSKKEESSESLCFLIKFFIELAGTWEENDKVTEG